MKWTDIFKSHDTRHQEDQIQYLQKQVSRLDDLCHTLENNIAELKCQHKFYIEYLLRVSEKNLNKEWTNANSFERDCFSTLIESMKDIHWFSRIGDPEYNSSKLLCRKKQCTYKNCSKEVRWRNK